METPVLRCLSCRNVVPVAPNCRVCDAGLQDAEEWQVELDRTYGYSLQAVEAHRRKIRSDPRMLVFLGLSGLPVFSGVVNLVQLVVLLNGPAVETAFRSGGPIILIASFFLLTVLPVLALLRMKEGRCALFVLLALALTVQLIDLVSLGNALGDIPNLHSRLAFLTFGAAYPLSIRSVGDEPFFNRK